MRDVWRWWKVRKQELKALLLLGMILLWMSLSLWKTERNVYVVLKAHEQSIKQLETAGQSRLDQLTEAMKAHQAQQDLDAAALRGDLWDIRFLIGQLIEQPTRPAVH